MTRDVDVFAIAASGPAVARGTLVATTDVGLLQVVIGDEFVECEALLPCRASDLNCGATVLVFKGDGNLPPVVLGAVGPLTTSHGNDAPETLVLEATDELTLRVGDGSITIRKDGKILIKGQDLVSHATRMNRIKGGAVAIN